MINELVYLYRYDKSCWKGGRNAYFIHENANLDHTVIETSDSGSSAIAYLIDSDKRKQLEEICRQLVSENDNLPNVKHEFQKPPMTKDKNKIQALERYNTNNRE